MFSLQLIKTPKNQKLAIQNGYKLPVTVLLGLSNNFQ